jgi:LysM repeat protein
MRRLRGVAVIAVGLMLLICFPLLISAQETKEEEGVYTIKKGDTLWDISDRFLKDPYEWPKLWERNPYITNPHWIYPGNPVNLSPEEPKKAAEEKVEVPKEVAKKEEPLPEVKEVKPVEPKPTFYPEGREGGFIGELDYRGVGTVIATLEGKNLSATGDLIYVAFKTKQPVMIGDKFTSISLRRLCEDPPRAEIGRKYVVSGNIEIIDQYGNYHTAKIQDCFWAVQEEILSAPI